jgi:hypothetical protein
MQQNQLFFYVSLTVHLSITLSNGQLDAQILNTFITVLYMYMFRVISCSSSGDQIVLIQHLVSSLSVSDRPVHRLKKNNTNNNNNKNETHSRLLQYRHCNINCYVPNKHVDNIALQFQFKILKQIRTCQNSVNSNLYTLVPTSALSLLQC